MLKMYLEKLPDGIEVVNDVEEYFTSVLLKIDDIEKALVHEIEHGELKDDKFFVDRFGGTLYLDCLSTGCKAALCVANSDKVISLVECGWNVHDVIVSILREGSVFLPHHGVSFGCESDDIDVCFDNYRFTSLDRLNYYIDYERPFKPDMKKEGIECLG